jgi:hypothetical protein
MSAVDSPQRLPDGTPLLDPEAFWDAVMLRAVPKREPSRRFSGRLGKWLSELTGFGASDFATSEIEWMPATRYSQYWSRMPAFALPAYYDGRIRINVSGREAKGIVPSSEYVTVCRQTTELLLECGNLLSGGKAVAEVYCPKQDSRDVGAAEADLYVQWEPAVLGLSHPQLGPIGPIPYRRTGGHTGPVGFLFVAGGSIPPGNRGKVSSFDVVPTILDLLGEVRREGISGTSLAAGLYAAEKTRA